MNLNHESYVAKIEDFQYELRRVDEGGQRWNQKRPENHFQ